jgi:hypothetical protein
MVGTELVQYLAMSFGVYSLDSTARELTLAASRV